MSETEEVKRHLKELQIQLANLQTENGGDGNTKVNAVSIKLSPFWPNKPEIWFAQAEAQFEIGAITKDATKYGHILSMLEPAVADEVEDVIANPPDEGKYENLKKELIKRFSVSREQRIRQLLGEEQMGDRKPSSFLRHLRSLAGRGNDTIVRELWMRHLPYEVQRILMAQLDLPLEKLADLADAIVETSPGRSVKVQATSAPSTDLHRLMDKMEELSKKVDALTADRSRRSRSSSRFNSRTRSSSRSGDKICWYHKRFDTKATKCIPPCTWKTDPGKAAGNH